MSFPVIVPILSVVDGGNFITVNDGTVYVAPARANLGIKVILVNIKTSGPVFFAADPYNPITANSFNFTPILKDGNYTAMYWPVNKKTGAEVPVANDFVYDSVGQVFQRWDATLAVPAWVTATDNDFYTYAQQYATVINNKHHPDFTKALDYLNRAYVNGNASISKAQLKEFAIELTIVKNGMITAFASAPATYQRIIEDYYSTVNMINNTIAP